MAGELNARIARTFPSPVFGVRVGEHGRGADGVAALTQSARGVQGVTWLLAGLAAALWPHWIYVARRLTDGSDEPWGVLALATVLVLLVRERAALEVPTRAALVTSGALAVLAAAASLWLPDLAAAAIAMLALGVFVAHALRGRSATPLAALLLLGLPVIASLQFYLGFPLRALTAHAVAALLGVAGLDVRAAGAALVFGEETLLVDAPCAGIGMLWVGSYTAALLSHLARAGAARTAANAAAAALLVLGANILRNAALFFPESGLARWPAWSHEAVGLGALALAIAPIVFICTRSSR